MDSLKIRQRHIQIVFLICAAGMILKAFQLQILDSSFRKRADATAIDEQVIYPSRGVILDRNQKLIVNNNATYDLMVVYNQVDPEMRTEKGNLDKIRLLCDMLGIKHTRDYFEALNKDWRSGKYSRNVPFVFYKKLDVETYAKVHERLYEFPGFFVQIRNIRGYSYPVGAHLLGYINEVNQQDIDKGNGAYRSGDYIGAAGLESEYESYLRGKKGVKYLLKDHVGRIVGPYLNGQKDTAAHSGSDLITSIDIDLQAYGEKLMSNKTGSIVAIEPESGEILAMISAPTYDPNELIMTQSRGATFSRLLNHPLKPFFDRTVMAKYPPGSIYKTVVSLIGLQEGTIAPDRGLSCNGGYFYAGRLYKCHNHGALRGVEDAIAYSCNTYYFAEFRKIIDKFGFNKPQEGLDLFNQYAAQMGIGQTLGIDYPNESPGNLPGNNYYNAIYPKNKGGWRSPTIMSLGIGQGELQLTTLQMANLAALIANRGYWFRPHLAKRFKDGTPIPAKFKEMQRVNIDRKHFQLVVDGMAQCVNHGTARACAVPGIQVCGKTGTSQNPHGDDHSVFFAFAPKDNPKIAIAVYVENAGWGASYAAPIASLMIEKYLQDSIQDPSRKWLEQKMVESNLVDKYLAQLEKKNPAPKPKRDTLPDPRDLPGDDSPDRTGAVLLQSEKKGKR